MRQKTKDELIMNDTISHIFIVQTETGHEMELLRIMRFFMTDGLVEDVFLPKRQVQKRLGGKWTKVTETLFKSYVFFRTSNPDELFLELKNVPKMSKLLHDYTYSFSALRPQEEEFLNRIKGKDEYMLGISTIEILDPSEKEGILVPYYEGQSIRIIDGPLRDMVGEIVGFDVHKRKAMIKTELFGGSILHVGIDLLKDK